MGGALFMAAVARRRRHAAADRQRAQRDLPVPARRVRPPPAGERGAPHPADGLGRPVPPPRPGRARVGHARRGVRASELVDGPQDLGRFGDDDEQGPRGDRGALAVRGAARGDRRRAASARASSTRWSNTSTGPCSRSSAIRTCARRSRRRSPTRSASTPGVARLDLAALASLSFEAPDAERFPCLGLAFEALRAGGSAPAVLNAANEVAVEAFLGGRARFTEIASTCAQTLSRIPVRPRRLARGRAGRGRRGPRRRPLAPRPARGRAVERAAHAT